MTKAIVGLSDWSQTKDELRALARAMDAGKKLPKADYQLNFADAAQLFGELTPARLRLLDTLKAVGPVSIYALAKRLERNYSNVHSDIGRLIELGLIEKDVDSRVLVRWDTIQIQLSLDGSRAA